MLRLPSLAIFRHRAYARLLLVRILSTLAMQIQATAIGWQIYDIARESGRSIAESSFLLGATGLAQFLPLFALSLFGGQAADRYDRRRIITACLMMKAVLSGMLLIASGLAPNSAMVAIFTVAALTGATNAFLPAATQALLPTLVPREELPQAIAWSSLGFQSSAIAGPALGGLLYGAGAGAAYGAALFLALAAAVMIATTRTPRQEKIENARTLAMIKEGLVYVRDNKIVLGAISLDLVVVLLAGAVALLPAFARDVLHAGPEELGWLRAATAIGAASVALLLAIAPLHRNIGRWMFAATFVFGAATIVFGLSTSFALTFSALAIAGGADMISVYVRQSLVQLATPDAMRGRVGAVSFIFISASNELGDFEAGVMARIFGPQMAVAIGGVLAMGAAGAWMRLFPSLARADGFEPER
ncbi:MAG: MFS transporter [Alphaproteobacteria bacterium]|nr:MFS transporter [Alphaproteobacteria bacterium]